MIFAPEPIQTGVVLLVAFVVGSVTLLLQWDTMRADAEQRQREADADEARLAGAVLANRRRRWWGD